jgi:hypothetical protein
MQKLREMAGTSTNAMAKWVKKDIYCLNII